MTLSSFIVLLPQWLARWSLGSGLNGGRTEAWCRHDTRCDLVEHVVDQEVSTTAAILRVDGGHQCSFLRGVVRSPLAGGVHPGDRMGPGLRHEGLGVLVRSEEHTSELQSHLNL